MSFPAYLDYQDSGIAWVGKMPVHWGVKQLKWLFDLQKRPVRDEDEIVTAFRDGIVTLRKHRREEGFTNSLKEIGYQGIRKGDLVIHAMDGFAGAIGVSDSDGKSTPVYSVCKPKEGSLSEYFGRLLRYMALSGFVDSLAKGVRERSTEFRWRDASVLPLPVPPVHEQRAIVHFLDRETAKIDALVGEQERLIALLKEKRQAVISHAVTKGLDPGAALKDSGIEWLGEIPAHWNVGKLGYFTRQIVDGAHFTPTYVDEGVPFLRVTDITKGIDLNEVKRIPEEEHRELIKRCKPEIGDLLLSKNGTVGVPEVITWEWEFSIFVSLCLLKLDGRLLSPFAKAVFNSKYIEMQINEGAKQSTVNNLHLEKIRSFIFPVPDLAEQNAIVQFVEEHSADFDELIGEAELAIRLLKERRAALISAAVTGKIDVRGLVEQREMEAA